MPPICLPEGYRQTQDATHVFGYLILVLIVQLIICVIYITTTTKFNDKSHAN
jgi:hypothetical protein